MHLRVFSESQCTEWRIFFGLLKVQIFYLGFLKFLIFDIFFWGGGVNNRCWARAYV